LLVTPMAHAGDWGDDSIPWTSFSFSLFMSDLFEGIQASLSDAWTIVFEAAEGDEEPPAPIPEGEPAPQNASGDPPPNPPGEEDDEGAGSADPWGG